MQDLPLNMSAKMSILYEIHAYTVEISQRKVLPAQNDFPFCSLPVDEHDEHTPLQTGDPVVRSKLAHVTRHGVCTLAGVTAVRLTKGHSM